VEKVTFADGTVWDLTQPLTFTWIGSSSSDSLFGSTRGNNVFSDTVSGTHYFEGTTKDDTYIYSPGNGNIIIDEQGGTNTVKFAAGVSANDVLLQASGNDLYFRFRNSSDTVRVRSEFSGPAYTVQRAVFADGTTWDLTGTLTFTWVGNGGFDALYGSASGNNVFSDTVSGTHYFEGTTKDDTYIYSPGNGNIIIDEQGGINTVKFAAGVSASDVLLQASGSNLYFRFRNSADSVCVRSEFSGSAYTVQKAVFADGTTWDLTGTLTFTWVGNGGFDALYGSASGNNVFSDTVSGTHYFEGTTRDDTYIYTPGNGNIIIDEQGGNDTVQFAAGVSPNNVYLQKSGNDLYFYFWNANDSVHVRSDFSAASYAVETATFADGTTWDLTHALAGTTGNDTLTGTAGNDIFFASPGTDTLTGGGGTDTYKFGSTFGQTTINNTGTDGSAPKGEIDFGASINHNQLWLKQSGSDLQIDLMGTNDSVTISGWYNGAGTTRAQVQSIATSDGSRLDSQLQQLVGAMASYAASSPSFNPTQSQMPADQTLQVAIAAAWH